MKTPFPEDPHSRGVDQMIAYLSQEYGLALARFTAALTLTWASENFKDFLIEPPETIEGLHLPELLWEFVGSEAELVKVLNGQENDYRLERLNRQNQDGSITYLNYLVLPFKEANGEAGLLLIVEDVTRTGRLEQELVQDRNELRLLQSKLARANASLEQLNHLKSLFLSIAAHDLRSPLTVIRGYTDLILSDLSPEALAMHGENLHSIRAVVGQLDRLIGDFLDLDSIERGKLSIRPSPCDLNALVGQVANSIAEQAKLHGLELTTNLAPGPIQIQADPERVQQILHNLFGNAVKYTPEGGQIQVRTWSEPKYGIFQVQDSGIGIPESDFDQVFDLYYRSEESQKSTVRGKGLGLFIVKYLVDAHQGKIEVENVEEGGTVFRVYFPIKFISL